MNRYPPAYSFSLLNELLFFVLKTDGNKLSSLHLKRAIPGLLDKVSKVPIIKRVSRWPRRGGTTCHRITWGACYACGFLDAIPGLVNVNLGQGPENMHV